MEFYSGPSHVETRFLVSNMGCSERFLKTENITIFAHSFITATTLVICFYIFKVANKDLKMYLRVYVFS